MYAITATSWRAISSATDVGPSETFSEILPQGLVRVALGIQVRHERSIRLRGSDWTQAPDSPLSLVERQAWATYRQALRDLPQLPGFPDIEWPRPPVLADGTADAGDGAGDI